MSSKTVPKAVTFSTAGIGGIIGWLVVHPFNTVAIRMNLQSASTASVGKDVNVSAGFLRNTTRIIKSEGVLSLYKGLSAGIVRQIFYATSRLGIFEVMRDMLSKYRQVDVWSRIGLGLFAGACSAVISCPAEVTMVRMSNDNALPVNQRRGYKNLLDAGYRIAREEGVLTFWRGCSPFVQRVMLVGVCQVATYDQFMVSYKELGVPSGFPLAFCSSMSSGLIFSLVTMPFETAKNRMAFQKPNSVTGALQYKSTYGTLNHIINNEGVMALWRGFVPYYCRCGGHTVVMFVAVEQLRQIYNKWR